MDAHPTTEPHPRPIVRRRREKISELLAASPPRISQAYQIARCWDRAKFIPTDEIFQLVVAMIAARRPDWEILQIVRLGDWRTVRGPAGTPPPARFSAQQRAELITIGRERTPDSRWLNRLLAA